MKLPTAYILRAGMLSFVHLECGWVLKQDATRHMYVDSREPMEVYAISWDYKWSCDLRWRVERTVPKTQLETATRPGVQSGLFYDIPTGSYLSDKFSHTARNFSHTFKCSRRAHILLGYWTSPWYVPHHCQWHHRGMWMRTSKYE